MEAKSFVENFIALDGGVEKRNFEGKGILEELESRREGNEERFDRLKGMKPRLEDC